MYLRVSVQQRVIDNISKLRAMQNLGTRVRDGYILNPYLENYERYTENSYSLEKSIQESDKKQDGPGISINLNLTANACDRLTELKNYLDQYTNRRFFPAQVIDILLICVMELLENPDDNIRISDEKLAKILLDLGYEILVKDKLDLHKHQAKEEIIHVLINNNLL